MIKFMQYAGELKPQDISVSAGGTLHLYMMDRFITEIKL